MGSEKRLMVRLAARELTSEEIRGVAGGTPACSEGPDGHTQCIECNINPLTHREQCVTLSTD